MRPDPGAPGDDLRDRTLAGVAWSALERSGGQGMNLLVYFVLVALVEPRAFGIIALAGVVVALVEVFVDQGFADAIVQREELEPEHLDTGFWVNLAAGLVLTAATFLLAGPVAGLFDEPGLGPVLRWMSLAFTVGALGGVQHARFRREMDFRTLSMRSLIGVGVGGVAGVAMAVAGMGVWALVAQELVRRTVGTAVLWAASDWRPGKGLSRRHFRDLFAFGVNVAGTRLLNFVNTRLDDLLIGFFLGSVALGYYSVAYNGLRALTALITSVTAQVALPLFSRLQSDVERLRRSFHQAVRYTAVGAFPVFLGVAAVAPVAVPTIFGEQWSPSVPVMQVLCFIGVLHSVGYFNASLIVALGRPGWRLALNAVNAAGNAVAFFIAVRWGIVAVAFAYVLRGYLFSPLPLWAVDRLMGLRLSTYLRNFVEPGAAALVMAVAVLAAERFLEGAVPGYLLLVGSVAGGAALYGALLRVTAPDLVRQAVTEIRRMRGALTS